MLFSKERIHSFYRSVTPGSRHIRKLSCDPVQRPAAHSTVNYFANIFNSFRRQLISYAVHDI